MSKEITVKIADRNLSIVGTFEQYLHWYDGWDADIGAHSKVSDKIPEGCVCIDAGANIGIIACTLAAKRPDLHIIAIEPVPDNFQNLSRNVHANGLNNVELIQAAVGEFPGSVRMSDNGPWSAVIADSPLEVPMIALDQFNDRQIGFVKIDTEGYEPHVLAGARELFDTQNPLVLMEFNAMFLMLHHYDPVMFSHAIWNSFEIVEMYCDENIVASATDGLTVIHDNVTAHKSVTDILMRPKSRVPELETMISSPELIALKKELRALQSATLLASENENQRRLDFSPKPIAETSDIAGLNKRFDSMGPTTKFRLPNPFVKPKTLVQSILPGFDPIYYLYWYPDVRISGVDPVSHYLHRGWKEGRDPSPGFSTKGYLAANPDVAAGNLNPLLHFVNAGFAEGRTGFAKSPDAPAPRATQISAPLKMLPAPRRSA